MLADGAVKARQPIWPDGLHEYLRPGDPESFVGRVRSLRPEEAFDIADRIGRSFDLDYVTRVSMQSAHMRIQLLQGYYLARPYEGDPMAFFARRPEAVVV